MGTSKIKGKKILVTAGPTHELIDPVRFIGNYSSGRMGYAIAEAFADSGADVTLISGPVNLKTENKNIKLVQVTSALEMYENCKRFIDNIDIAVFNAAVADFTPVNREETKVKRGRANWTIELKPTVDIAATLGREKREGQFFVGFALETNNEIENAVRKLTEKNMDMIVLNSLRDKGAGFGGETNKVSFIDHSGNIDKFELKDKREVAADILDRIEKQI